MNYFHLSLHFAALLALLVSMLLSYGHGMEDFKKCRGVDLGMAEEHAFHITECLKEAGADDIYNVAPDKMPCFGKCVFAKKGLIDTNGHPHKEKLMSMMTDNLPEEVHKELTKKFEDCLHPNITEVIDPDDESCVTFVPVMMCISLSFMEECEKKD